MPTLKKINAEASGSDTYFL